MGDHLGADPLPGRADVAIVGGGMAGLSLALQIGRELPDLDVVVLERGSLPAPHGAHKVGESSTEIGAWYWTDRLELRDELDRSHVRKMGLRYFVGDGTSDEFADRLEIGPRAHMFSATYQIDRGRFDNELASRAVDVGVAICADSRVRSIDLGDDGEQHRISVVRAGEETVLTCRWVIDASGRRSMLKRQLDLAEATPHHVNASWFRIACEIRVDDWVDGRCAADWGWAHRVPSAQRWMSTNHLMGRGYWVWIIPLSDGLTSVGIVADPNFVAPEEVATFERFRAWAADHEHHLSRAIDDGEDDVVDFHHWRDISHGCRQVFSADRWAMTGESGVFLDPLYSPGADFIAVANEYIVDLIGTDLDGGDLATRAELANRRFLRNYRQALPTWLDQYQLMGDPVVWSAKVSWDTLVYFSMIGLNYVNGGTADLDFMESISPLWARFGRLSEHFQQFLIDWHNVRSPGGNAGFLDMSTDLVREFNAGLVHPMNDREQLAEQLAMNLQFLECLAGEFMRAAADHAGIGVERVDPYRFSIDGSGDRDADDELDELPEHPACARIPAYVRRVFEHLDAPSRVLANA